MRPPVSVSGMRCTRCTPDSNFSRANTPSPEVDALLLDGTQRFDGRNDWVEAGKLLRELGAARLVHARIELGLDRVPPADHLVQLVSRDRAHSEGWLWDGSLGRGAKRRLTRPAHSRSRREYGCTVAAHLIRLGRGPQFIAAPRARIAHVDPAHAVADGGKLQGNVILGSPHDT